MVASVSYLPTIKKPKLWTDRGLEILGNLVKASREALGISQRDMSELIQERTGFYISNRNLGDIENAKIVTTWNRLSAIAAAEFVFHPVTGALLTVEDLVNIASEVVDPYSLNNSESVNNVAIHVSLHHHLEENRDEKIMHYHYQVELPPITSFVEEKNFVENKINEIAKTATKVWYSWVTCNGSTCCYKFTQDGHGNITSAKVENAKCQ